MSEQPNRLLRLKPVNLVPVVASGQRPTLLELWGTYHFQPETLAFVAGVERQIITEMFCYQPVSLQQAQKVLAALSRLLNKSFTILTVDVPVEDSAYEHK